MNLIAAVDKNWAIGKDNNLLVSIPSDMKNIEIIMDTNMVGIILMLNSNPIAIAAKKNKTF